MIEIDGYLHPFDNAVVRRNLGHGDDMTLVLSKVRDWSIAVDGGANVGRVANRLAEKFETVFAVELAAENFACLTRNAKAGVRPIHACLSNNAGIGFDYEPDSHVDSPVYCVKPGPGTVPSITIDSLCLKACGFIKLDLQGYDYFALLGAIETLKAFKPPIYFEHKLSCAERYGVTANAPGNFLSALGYENLETRGINQTWAIKGPMR